MAKRIKTNEDMLKALFKSLHTMEAALLRERIQRIADITRAGIEKKPTDFDNPIVSHTAYLGLCDKIDKYLELKDKQKPAN